MRALTKHSYSAISSVRKTRDYTKEMQDRQAFTADNPTPQALASTKKSVDNSQQLGLKPVQSGRSRTSFPQ
jgi:hypothetical protein